MSAQSGPCKETYNKDFQTALSLANQEDFDSAYTFIEKSSLNSTCLNKEQHYDYIKAEILFRQGETGASLLLGKQLVSQVDTTAYSKFLGDIYNLMGSAAYLNSDYQNSLKYYLKAEKVFTIAFPANKPKVLGNIGMIMSKVGQTEKGIDYFKEALREMEIQQAPNEAIVNTLLNIGATYNRLNPDSAISYTSRALQLSNRAKLKRLVSRSEASLSNAFLRAQIYDSAIYYARRVSAEEDIALFSKAQSHYVIASAYKEMQQPTLGMSDALKAVSLTRKGGTPTTLMASLELLYEIQRATNMWKEALNTYEDFKRIEDSLVSQKKAQELNEILTKHDTELKDQQIKSLENLNTLQKKTVTRTRQLLAVIIIASLVLTVLTYFIYRQRIQRSRAQDIIARHKIASSRLNPHFIFNALSSIQQSVLENKDVIRTSDYLAQFSEMTRDILTFTEEEKISLSRELDFLQNYLDLQKLRAHVDFTYEFIIDSDIETDQTFLPPMMLQPFLENALEHAFSPDCRDNHLIVAVSIKQNQLIINVEDNGYGIAQTTSVHKPYSNSLAIKLIRERLKLIQKRVNRKADIKITDLSQLESKLKGTRIEINLPVL
ncbi:MAG: hypothetical protein Roseis2KO_08210 [Roseivirga sp.]